MTDGMLRDRIVLDLETGHQEESWPDRWSMEYLLVAYDENENKQRREELRDQLKAWIISNCEQDENGNYLYYFDKPIIIDENEFSGLMAQRRVTEIVNIEKAYELADKYNVRSQVVKEVKVEELDLDAMYALNQQGVISDEDIDSLLDLRETFALVKMED